MPGPAIHHIIAEELKNRISAENPRERINLFDDPMNNRKIQELLSQPENLPYYYLGCQGPDFLFFNTQDWPGGLSLPKFLMNLNEMLENFENKIEKAIPPSVVSALEDVEQLANDIPGVSEARIFLNEVSGLLDAFSQTLIEGLKAVALNGVAFEILTHPYRDGEEPEGWWWFDILHYRKTGEFVKTLIENTKDDLDSPLILYALGYLTHYAGDTVGHPYVNMISGGPYRSHGQRHKVGENFQDVFNFEGDFTSSNLHAFYNFNYRGVIDTRDDDPEDHLPDPDSDMPNDLANLILKTLKDVYANNNGKFEIGNNNFTTFNIKEAYEIYYRYLKSSTTLGLKLPKPKSYQLTRELVEIWGDVKDRIGNIADSVEGVNFPRDISIVNIIETITEIIAASWALAVAFAEVLKEALEGAIAITGKVLSAAVASLYELVYDAFQNFRLLVVLNGFGFPMAEHLDNPLLSQFKKPKNNDPLGINCSDDVVIDYLPFEKINRNILSFINLSKQLVYPISRSPFLEALPEIPTISKDPLNMYLNETSLFYATEHSQTNIKITEAIDLLMDVQTNNRINSNESFQDAMKRIFKERTLGNAVKLSEICLKRVLNNIKIPDFNLDSDRGYGYLCWKKEDDKNENNPSKLESGNTENIVGIKN